MADGYDKAEERLELKARVTNYVFRGRITEDETDEVEFVVDGDVPLSRLMLLVKHGTEVFCSMPKAPASPSWLGEGWVDPLFGIPGRVIRANPHPKSSDKAYVLVALRPPISISGQAQTMRVIDGLRLSRQTVDLVIEAYEPIVEDEDQRLRSMPVPMFLQPHSTHDRYFFEGPFSKMSLVGGLTERVRDAGVGYERPMPFVLGAAEKADVALAKMRVWSLDGRSCELASDNANVHMSIWDFSWDEELFLMLAKDEGQTIPLSIRPRR